METIEQYEKYIAELLLLVDIDLDDTYSVIGDNHAASMVFNRARISVKLIKDHHNNYLLSKYKKGV